MFVFFVGTYFNVDQIGCLIRVPTEVVKQRMQAGLHKTLPEAIGTAYKMGGFGGFYVGYGATLMREIPFSFIQFPIYEAMKVFLSFDVIYFCLYYQAKISESRNGVAPLPYESALCGAISGAFSAGLTTPLDVLKTRRMLSLQSNSQQVCSSPHITHADSGLEQFKE